MTDEIFAPYELIGGKPMNLFHVQDSDRPMYVIAENWQAALEKWKNRIKEENGGDVSGEPSGIALIAREDELLP